MALENRTPDHFRAHPDEIPQTLNELQAYCDGMGMPLAQMRFFIGLNLTEPRCFGIYQNTDGSFVVYKNKSDGTRAVRYRGNDEAYAVRELFLKIQDEAQQRRIKYGGAVGPAANNTATRSGLDQTANNQSMPMKANGRGCATFAIVIAAIFIVYFFVKGTIYALNDMGIIHLYPRDGYYTVDDTYYYYGGDSWYYYDDNSWSTYDSRLDDEYDTYYDYYSSNEYDPEYGTGDIRDSIYWDEIYSYDDDDDDFWGSDDSWDDDDDWDSWDSYDTDWDSNW